MHACRYLMLVEYLADELFITDVTLVKRNTHIHSRAMSINEIVDHDDRLIFTQKVFDRNTADVARTARNKDRHVCSILHAGQNFQKHINSEIRGILPFKIWFRS